MLNSNRWSERFVRTKTEDLAEKQTGTRTAKAGVPVFYGLRGRESFSLFDRFYQVDSARTRDGTGLGLAIARLIADSPQGFIRVESTPGAGSVFIVQIPFT